MEKGSSKKMGFAVERIEEIAMNGGKESGVKGGKWRNKK